MKALKLAILAISATLLSACIGIVYEETGLPLVSEVRTLSGFDRVILDDNAEVEITAGQEFSIRVQAPEGYLHRIQTRVMGDTLVITQDDMSLSPEEVRIYIKMPALNAVTMEAAGSIEAKGIDSDYFELNVNGLGDMSLSGDCRTMIANVNGMGDLSARKLRCENVDLTFDGVGSASVYAALSIKANASGIGSIDVYGNPRSVRKDISGIGSFDIHN